jgi:RsiG-like
LITTERVLRLLEPAYASDLTPRSLEELRAMHDESAQAELALSYYRRLAQARIEILEAEEARRASGGSVEDLIADLPNILGAESRSTVATTRGAPSADAPTMELHWPDGREQLVVDMTLAHLPTISADELADTITALRTFEGELSDLRGQLHLVIDAIDRVLADRRVSGTAG